VTRSSHRIFAPTRNGEAKIRVNSAVPARNGRVLNPWVEHKKEWAHKGCSILSDGWRDTTVQKDIVNFFVNSPKGSVFIRSMDVSEVIKDANFLFKVLDDMVEEVGEENVVQVVTDNTSNYVKAGKKLRALIFFVVILE